MNEIPRRKLTEIIAKYGRSIVENPRRLEGLLRDYCGEFRREISVIVLALEEHAPLDLLAADKSLPRQVLLARLTRRLCDNLALSEVAARWSIETWALALNVISKNEIVANEPTQTTHQINTTSANTNSVIAVTAPQTNFNRTQTAVKSFIISADGSGDFKTISNALQNTEPDSRLLVREGIYDESLIIDKKIEIIGDGAVEKIIVRSRNASCLLMQTPQAKIGGLSFYGNGKTSNRQFFAVDIPYGELILENCRISSDTLSGISIHGVNANPLLKNCLIYGGADSGIYFYDNSRGRLENCDIAQNANDNVAITQGANPSIKNCRVFGGNNGGIVVFGNGAAGLIEDCQIYQHRLANIAISQNANPIFRRCKISGGKDTGVFIHQNGHGTLEECDIFQNQKAEVGISDGGNSIFRGCRIHNGENSGVILQDRGRTTIENCTIYDNADAGVSLYSESMASIKNCRINRNQTVAVRIQQNSAARVENCDLRENYLATWETEHGVKIERSGNIEG